MRAASFHELPSLVYVVERAWPRVTPTRMKRLRVGGLGSVYVRQVHCSYAAVSLRAVTQSRIVLAFGNVVFRRDTRSAYGMVLQASNLLVGCGARFGCNDLRNRTSRDMGILSTAFATY